MKRTSKVLAILLALAMVVTMMAACGTPSGGGDGGGSTDGGDDSGEDVSAPALSKPRPAGGVYVHVAVWKRRDGPVTLQDEDAVIFCGKIPRRLSRSCRRISADALEFACVGSQDHGALR